jgi:DNA-binding MarR family transcriptional regulator
MPAGDVQRRVDAVRGFNRFYTKQIGVLHEGLLGSPYSLTEVRVLYELAHRERPTAAELGKELGLDAGYLSRLLRGFERQGLVTKARSKSDGRQSLLSLTAQGRKAFAPLNARSHDEVAAMLGGSPRSNRSG